jgi:hypothetical protein
MPVRDQLATLLDAIRDAQGVLRSQAHSAIKTEMLRAILCNPKVCTAMRICDEPAIGDPDGSLHRLREPAHQSGLPI